MKKGRNKKIIYIILAVFVLAAGITVYEFFSFGKQLSFVEPNNEQKEFIGNTLIIRHLDKKLISRKIEEGKEYLFRMIDKKENGAHKYYYAVDDTFENRLHTTYTVTLAYTLLKLYNLNGDDSLLKQALKCGDFVLFMQNKEKGTKGYGAFYYSYFLDSKEKEKRFVVGTTSKSIYTLLKLYGLSGDRKYLESAEIAADWLVTIQESDGSMKPYIRYDAEKKKWVHGVKDSILYDGEVLSALSRIYLITGNKKHYQAAEKIAQHFAQKYEEAGKSYIVGETRSKNPISNSWVVMSYIDFYKASRDDYYKEVIFDLSDLILKNQKNDADNILDYGQFKGGGNGWIIEVMAETYNFCRAENRDDCDKYKKGIVRAIRWLIQNTYSKENSSMLKNPERANGGIYWNEENRYVRTDSVAHALNGYIGIINYLEDGALISIPKNP